MSVCAFFLHFNKSFKSLHQKHALQGLASLIRSRRYTASLLKSLKIIKLSMFQFKINHNIIYTQDKLLRAKIVENGKCQACGCKQALVHLLVECQYVDTFWNSFASWWNRPVSICKNSVLNKRHHLEALGNKCKE